jgi:methyltransferase (TIGR00027 family)
MLTSLTMKPGQESQTAVWVCMSRAIAHEAPWAAGFRDPTALALLPDAARARVERVRAGVTPRGWRECAGDRLVTTRAYPMVVVARTIAIDAAVREAAAPQLVLLGAGLDGRAWRMPELCDAVVFEVDHPDSQRSKRARAAALAPTARDVRFVAVDFERDCLDEALASAGHDPAAATTWIWEGVVMYLAPPAIAATLAVIKRRSAPASRLVVNYHRPALALRLVRPVMQWVGEPLRSTFTADAMRELLGRYGFAVVRDQDLPEIGAALSMDIARNMRAMRHIRITMADRCLPV